MATTRKRPRRRKPTRRAAARRGGRSTRPVARKRTGRRHSGGAPSTAWQPRWPELDQSQRDVLGLGLVALGVFMGFVLYGHWNGGRVGAGWRTRSAGASAKRGCWPRSRLCSAVARCCSPRCAHAMAAAHRRPVHLRGRDARARGGHARCQQRHTRPTAHHRSSGIRSSCKPTAGSSVRRSTGGASARAERGRGHPRRVPALVGIVLLTGASLAAVLQRHRQWTGGQDAHICARRQARSSAPRAGRR